ncbi:MAG: hypothetical protein FWG78_02725 [Coriobacteriia bacterium]|nr:hypothetical protein [Coriobacteriia bacterium]
MKRFWVMLALVAMLVGALAIVGCANDTPTEEENAEEISQSSVTAIMGNGDDEEVDEEIDSAGVNDEDTE